MNSDEQQARKQNSIRSELFRAFSERSRPYPKDGFRLTSFEGQALSEFLGTRERESIALRDLGDYPHDLTACFAFMKVPGVLYYLPMIASLSLDADKTDLPFSVLELFDSGSHANNVPQALTPQEKQALLEAMLFVYTNYPGTFDERDVARFKNVLGS